MFLFKNICFALLLYVICNGLAFDIFDGVALLEGSPEVTMSDGELNEVIDIEDDAEYTTISFRFEHEQNLIQYDNPPGERCYNDHVKCLTTILSSSRLVCATNRDENVKREFGSLCDIYLTNCKRKEAYWTVIDNGNCSVAEKIKMYNITEKANDTIIEENETTTEDSYTTENWGRSGPNIFRPHRLMPTDFEN